jgi:uncharacterized protein (DUF885 family)
LKREVARCGAALALALALTLLAGVAPFAKAAPVPGSDFDAFAEHLAQETIRMNPARATFLQYFDGADQDRLDRELASVDGQYSIPMGASARARYVALARGGLAGLRRFKRSELTPLQQISAQALEWQLKDELRMARAEDHRYVFEQFGGLQINVVNLLTQIHPLRNARDVDNYLARLDRVAPVLDEGIRIARARAARGVIPPRFILKATLDGIDRFLTPAPGENVLVTTLKERAALLQGYSGSDGAVTRAETTVRASIRPAFERVRSLLAGQLEHATDDAGLWHQPGGDEAYLAMLHSNTTTDLSPEEIHAIGLKEVARIEGEMDGMLRSLGYTEGTVTERYQALEHSVQPPAEPDPRPGLIEQYTHILRDAEERSKSLFDLRPTAPVEVHREPAYTEKNAAAHYLSPSPDGTRPGRVMIPLPGPSYEVLEMRTLIYHEGVPGHHFQVALQQENQALPRYRRQRVFGVTSSFAEGWALYAEQLAAESGWYEGDPKGELGQLWDELFRARRLVVDTGLHAMHWTRQQAIDYGIPVAEVERYVAMPGQACAYKIGELEIIKERTKAQAALGGSFSLRQFHDWMLQTGTVPLAVLGPAIDEKIAASKH